ncbi:glycosyltransferase [Butyrivibrio sp. LB2008]|uniref:glycosyltransferase n=1 Tax=Butyrivibrio sp. LB2008 TaxID=1408305 RepID=UPI000685A96B|nr:glycosyltransferase [Butyrivibrio sp. LB2008]
MKVLLIDVNCKSSSTGQIVYNLYSYINAQGGEASVCYGRGPVVNERNIYKFGIDVETYLHAFLTRITGYTGCFSFFSTKRLIKYIEDFKPDVVHIHELHAYFVNIKQLLDYLAEKKIKIVHTLHCEFSYTGKCGHSVECEKWKKECGECPHLRDYPITLWFDHTKRMKKEKQDCFNKIDNLIIVTPSQWLAERTRMSFFKDRRIEVIHNGVDTNIFKPVDSSELKKELGIDFGEKVILAIAPNLMSKEKGGCYVLQVAKRLKNEHIRFVLVGVDGDTYENLSNCIIKPRIYEKEILAKYYSMADGFIICSERENYPTTCLEAQACGTPVFGFATGGVIETSYLDENRFVDYGDVEGLIKEIRHIEKKSNELIARRMDSVGDKVSNELFLRESYKLFI